MGQLDSTCRAPPRPPACTTAGCRDVAVQVAFERQALKPVFSLDRLWVMGQLDSNLRRPTANLRGDDQHGGDEGLRPCSHLFRKT
jgi:hypothetical protein